MAAAAAAAAAADARVRILWRVAHDALSCDPPRVPLAVQALSAVDAMPLMSPAVRVANSVRLAKTLMRFTTARGAARAALERVLPLVDARSPAHFELVALLFDVWVLDGGAHLALLARPLASAAADALARGHHAWHLDLTVRLVRLHALSGRPDDALQLLSHAMATASAWPDHADALALLGAHRLCLLVEFGQSAAAVAALDEAVSTLGALSERALPYVRCAAQAAALDLLREDAFSRLVSTLFGAAAPAMPPCDGLLAATARHFEARAARPTNSDHTLRLLESAAAHVDAALASARTLPARTAALRLAEQIAGTTALAHLGASDMPKAAAAMQRAAVCAAQTRSAATPSVGGLLLRAMALHRAGWLREAMDAWALLAAECPPARGDITAAAALHLRLVALLEGDVAREAEARARRIPADYTASVAVDALASYVTACGELFSGEQQAAKDCLSEALNKLRRRSYFELLSTTLLLLGDIYEHLNTAQARDMFDKALTLAHVQRAHLLYALCAQKCQQQPGTSREAQVSLAAHMSEALSAHNAALRFVFDDMSFTST